jgi:uncharacterized protein YcfJ
MSLAGGIGGGQAGNALEGDGLAADAFVRAKVPALTNATLVSFRTQVVAGTNFFFTYEGHEGEVRVWSQTWTGLLQITLPDGTVISNQ